MNYKNNYVYEITNITNDMKYIGCRSCNCEPKEDIGKKYFSCSHDKEFQEEQKTTNNFEYKVLQVFRKRKEAIQLEIDLHAKYDVGANPKYYNKAKQTSTGWDTTGTKASIETRKKISKAGKGRIFTEEHKRNLSLVEKTPEHRRNLSLAAMGNTTLIDRIWITTGDKSKMILPNEKIPEGWKLGRGFNISKAIKGRIYITDGLNTKMVKPELKVPEGWFYGQGPTKQKPFATKFITNGNIRKTIKIDEEIPEGWYEGVN